MRQTLACLAALLTAACNGENPVAPEQEYVTPITVVGTVRNTAGEVPVEGARVVLVDRHLSPEEAGTCWSGGECPTPDTLTAVVTEASGEYRLEWNLVTAEPVQRCYPHVSLAVFFEAEGLQKALRGGVKCTIDVQTVDVWLIALPTP